MNQMYDCELVKFMYKIVYNCFPGCISCYYSHITDGHDYPTRILLISLLFNLKKSKKSLTQRTVQYRGPRPWNNIAEY